jgi:hypothetical protein
VTLVWGFFCQGVRQCNARFCPSSVSLFDLKARFFVPTRSSARPSRAGAVKVGRCNNLSTCFALARPYLDRFEHDGTLRAVATTIRGEPAFGRGSIAPQPCIRWVQDPNHDAVIRIGSEAPRRRTHSTFRHDSHESPRDPATSNRRRRPVTSGRIGPKLLGAFSDLRSLRRAQNDAVRYHAFSHQPPQGDQ